MVELFSGSADLGEPDRRDGSSTRLDGELRDRSRRPAPAGPAPPAATDSRRGRSCTARFKGASQPPGPQSARIDSFMPSPLP